MIVLRKTFWFESLKINKLKVWGRSTSKETEDPLRKTGEREKEKAPVTLGVCDRSVTPLSQLQQEEIMLMTETKVSKPHLINY